MVCLLQEFDQVAQVQRQLLAVTGAPCRPVDNGGNTRAGYRVQLLVALQAGNELRIRHLAPHIARHVLAEIGDDLKQSTKFGIVGLEQKIQFAIAEQGDFDAQRDRLWLER